MGLEAGFGFGGGLPLPARGRSWSFFVCAIWPLCVAGVRGPFCFFLSEFDVGVSCLALLAPVRGGTSFLFPTAKKKRSKENAYKRQPVGVALAQPRPWSVSRTVLAVPGADEHPSCFKRHCTLRPHGRTAKAQQTTPSCPGL